MGQSKWELIKLISLFSGVELDGDEVVSLFDNDYSEVFCDFKVIADGDICYRFFNAAPVIRSQIS